MMSEEFRQGREEGYAEGRREQTRIQQRAEADLSQRLAAVEAERDLLRQRQAQAVRILDSLGPALRTTTENTVLKLLGLP